MLRWGEPDASVTADDLLSDASPGEGTDVASSIIEQLVKGHGASPGAQRYLEAMKANGITRPSWEAGRSSFNVERRQAAEQDKRGAKKKKKKKNKCRRRLDVGHQGQGIARGGPAEGGEKVPKGAGG